VNPGAGTPTGQVSFSVDGTATPDSPVALDGTGKATCAAVTSLTVGTHSIVVTYLGDNNFGRAMFGLTQTVNQAASSTAVTSSQNPSGLKAPVTISAAVTAVAPGAGTPTGNISIQVDGAATPDSPIALNGTGQATSAPLAALAAGTHQVVVNYAGDANFANSSGSLAQTVKSKAGG
jgi:large repetitive protein